MLRLRLAALSLLVLLAAPFAAAQTYTSVVVFGDSLSDVGNDAHLVQANYGARFPGPLFNYTDGRFTDGTDTHPPAVNFTGVWVEQLAATFPAHPTITDSLDGGTDFAFGSATTANGTHVESDTIAGVTFSITVDDMGQQVTNYLAAHSTIPANTLFVVWGGANDLAALVSTGGQNAQTLISTAASQDVALVQRPIAAGATDIVVPNLPPLGLIPRFNTNPTLSAAATAAATAYNTALAAGLAALPAANSTVTLHLFPIDTFTLFNTVVAAPAANDLTNVTVSAQGLTSANPDQYLFWDDLHPTTAGHHLLAVNAAQTLNPSTPVAPALTAALSPTSITVASGASGTSTLTLTPTGGFSSTASAGCGTLPAHLSCALSSTSFTFTGSSTAQTATVTIGTDNAAALARPRLFGPGTAARVVSALLLPTLGIGLLGLRRRTPGIRLLSLFGSLLLLGSAATLSGCGGGGSSNKAPSGTYTVPITVTAGSTTSTVDLTVVVQ